MLSHAGLRPCHRRAPFLLPWAQPPPISALPHGAPAFAPAQLLPILRPSPLAAAAVGLISSTITRPGVQRRRALSRVAVLQGTKQKMLN